MDEVANGMLDEGVDDIDRISYLPEFIIYHIMSLLPTKEVGKTRVLSKRWERLQGSYPNLDFDQTYFGSELDTGMPGFRVAEEYPDIDEKRDKFVRFVDNTLLRFREQNLRIWKFNLFFTPVDFEMASLVERWIAMATEIGVEELDIQIPPPMDAQYYTLPQPIFAVKSIKTLSLGDCKLEKPLRRESIRFHSLQDLCLTSVHVDAQVIEDIISSCPQIEKIELQLCVGLTKVHLSGLHNLKRVKVQWNKMLETFDIVAPSLQGLFLSESQYKSSPCKLTLIACQNLKHLHFTRIIITDQQFNDLIFHLPLLEALDVDHCSLLERIKIRNQSLKYFHLSCEKLAEVEIDAPNLLAFKYWGNSMPSITSTSTSGRWEAYLWLLRNEPLNSQWFSRVRYFLTTSKRFKSLTLSIPHSEIAFGEEGLRDISLPSIHTLKHVRLELQSPSISYSALVDGLLWSCQPETLSIKFMNLESRNKFIEVLHMKIVHKVELISCCIRSIQCWQRVMKVIESNDGYGRPLHWNTLLAELPNWKESQEMCITFKW